MQQTCAMQRTTCKSERQHKQRAACTDNMWTFDDQRNGQSAANSRRHATRNRQHARCARLHAACIMQRTQQQTTDRVQHATSNVQHATDIAKKISTNTQRAECNRQRIADDLQEDACSVLTHARCNGKHTALPHFGCGEQRAAEDQQHARSIVLDNQCATRHRRHTQDATYDPCRSMQQTHIKIHGVRRKKSGRSRTSGLCQLPHGHSAGKYVRSIPTPRNPMSQTRKTKWMQGERERPEASETPGSRRSDGA
jgi:hypothetical protein